RRLRRSQTRGHRRNHHLHGDLPVLHPLGRLGADRSSGHRSRSRLGHQRRLRRLLLRHLPGRCPRAGGNHGQRSGHRCREAVRHHRPRGPFDLLILGDGAGAGGGSSSDEPGISKTVWGSKGESGSTIRMTDSLIDIRDNRELPFPTLRQDGPNVFRWAVWDGAEVAKEALTAAGIEAGDLAAFVPHQANMRIIDELAKQLKLPNSVVVPREIADNGNTSAASIPLATERLLRVQPELSGGLALQIGFGAGLVYGAQVVRLP